MTLTPIPTERVYRSPSDILLANAASARRRAESNREEAADLRLKAAELGEDARHLDDHAHEMDLAAARLEAFEGTAPTPPVNPVVNALHPDLRELWDRREPHVHRYLRGDTIHEVSVDDHGAVIVSEEVVDMMLRDLGYVRVVQA